MKREKNKTTLSEKKEVARNVGEQRDKGWIHVIRVHDTIHSADNNTAGQQTLTNYPTQRKKDQTTNADGKRKMVALIRQANS